MDNRLPNAKEANRLSESNKDKIDKITKSICLTQVVNAIEKATEKAENFAIFMDTLHPEVLEMLKKEEYEIEDKGDGIIVRW